MLSITRVPAGATWTQIQIQIEIQIILIRPFRAIEGQLKPQAADADEAAMRMLEPATFVGLGIVAIWLYVRFPGRRPGTVMRAAIHVIVSFTLFNFVPYALGPCAALPHPFSVLTFVAGLLLPTLSYVLLSWLWLMARIHDLGNPKPRGGHPVASAAAR